MPKTWRYGDFETSLGLFPDSVAPSSQVAPHLPLPTPFQPEPTPLQTGMAFEQSRGKGCASGGDGSGGSDLSRWVSVFSVLAKTRWPCEAAAPGRRPSLRSSPFRRLSG